MTIAECFKTQREIKGLSQLELAEAINVRQAMVAQIERGCRVPSANILIATSKCLHCTTDSLLGLDQDQD